jgi:hypothetical protein
MTHRLPLGAFFTLLSSSLFLAACAAGGENSGDDDDDSVDARALDSAALDALPPDGGTPDALLPDGMTPDAAPGLGDTCETAEAITLTGGTATVTGTTATASGYTNNYDPSSTNGCEDGDGRDRVYTITVPAGQRLTAAFTTQVTSFDATLYLVAAPATTCNATPLTCLAGVDGGGNGGAETITYNNTGSASVDVLLVVDGYNPDDEGAYSLAVTVANIPPTPQGDTCQTAETVTLTSGTATIAATNATASGFSNDYDGSSTNGCANGDGNDRVHVVTVPAGERLTVTLTTQVSSFDATLNLVAAPAATCDASPLVCLNGVDGTGSGGAETMRYDNTTVAPVDVMIVVDGYNADDEGAYSLAVTVSPPPAGDTCATAETITLTDGTANLSGTTTTAAGFSNNYDSSASSCPSGAGNDHVYRVTVPAGELLVATARPTGFDATVYLVAGPASACDVSGFACLDGSDSGALEGASYTNTTANPVDVFLVVDGYSSTSQGTYDLAVRVGPALGDTCQAAETVTLTAGAATILGSTASPGYAANYAPPAACTSDYAAVGNDHAYTVPVPTGTTLTATMTPAGWDGSVYFLAGPAAACDATPIACLAGRDTGTSGVAEIATYMNTTGATVEVMVVVDSYSASANGPYSLAVQVQ